MEGIGCRQSELMIGEFINGALTGDELFDFLNHVRTCRSCFEELETQYLLSEALLRLENGETIDLKREINSKIRNCSIVLRIHRYLASLCRSMEIIAFILLSWVIVTGVSVYL